MVTLPHYYKCEDYSDTIAKNAVRALYKTLCKNLQFDAV